VGKGRGGCPRVASRPWALIWNPFGIHAHPANDLQYVCLQTPDSGLFRLVVSLLLQVFRGCFSPLLCSSFPPDSRLQTPVSRLFFRVFHDFRGSCCFRGFRAFRGSVLFIAILAVFAFLLLAAAPAPAQTTTTLLDIKSPATASPPNASLLAISDAGDLRIKGQPIEYSYPGTITLDPSRLYWTLGDSDGNVLWALEVYDRGPPYLYRASPTSATM